MPTQPKSTFETDVCIVGTGPAGLSLARELSKTGLRICLLEAGAAKPNPVAADLDAGEVDSAHGYRAETFRVGRRRQLGGSAHLWNHEQRGLHGQYIRCLPLDDIDFEARDWVPLSGWPFTRQTLAPYYEQAHKICRLGAFDRSAENWLQRAPGLAQPWQSETMETIVSQFSDARIYQTELLAELNRASNVIFFPRSVVLSLRADPTHPEAISAVEAVRADGVHFLVRAAQYVLAAGGLENARILLLNEVTQKGGPGNQHDMVGRCFMDHPAISLGTLVPASGAIYDRATFYDQHCVDGHHIMGQLRLRSEVMRREKLLNACAVLVPHLKNLRANLPAVIGQVAAKAPRFLMRKLRPELSSLAGEREDTSLSLRQRLLQGYYTECVCGWSELTRKASRLGAIGVRSLVEQSPDPANRIVLSEQRDAYGQRRIKLFWRWNEIDLRSIRRTQEIFGREFAAAGLGTFTPAPDASQGAPRTFFSPHHFMGTTRMHTDPQCGVVDANSRVHGLQNLFVTGSSVFPTGGFANPTLTIIALALRLADHLKDLAKLNCAPVFDLKAITVK